MRKKTLILSALAGLVLFGVLFVLLMPQPNSNSAVRPMPEGITLMPQDRAITAQGRLIYQGQCASCHGDNLEGQVGWRDQLIDGKRLAPPHDETGHTWHHPDEMLFQLTKNGIGAMMSKPYPNNMPIYKDILSDTEIIAALSYIKSRWPKETQAIHDQINANYQQNKQ